MQAYVVGPPRTLAAIKDTNWVLDRKPLSDQLPQDAIEGLLQTADGCLLEGLVTNLYVLCMFLLVTRGRQCFLSTSFDPLYNPMPLPWAFHEFP